MQLKPIRQQVVVVFGASSGIGRQTALQFAKRGARLVVAARSESGLKSLAQEIQEISSPGVATDDEFAFKGECTTVVADVSVFEQVQAVAEHAIASYGRIDTWVHTPATSVFATFDQLTPEEFRRVIDVSLMGQVYGAMVALPHLKREGGAFISISSMEGRRSLPFQSAYSSAKHGIEGFLESLRVELQHEQAPVSVTSIKPSVINTPFYNNAQTKLGVKPTGIPPYYQPHLVADAVLYAAEHPMRDLIVGDVGRLLNVLQRLSPALVDTLLVQFGFQLQKTQEPKSENDPHNLYEPVPAYDRVEGDFGHLTIPSLTEWLDRKPSLHWSAIAGITIGAVALAILTIPLLKSNRVI